MLAASQFQLHQATILLIFLNLCLKLTLADDFYPPGITAAELLRHRGFQADEFFVETKSGYILRVTRGLNPLIEGGRLASKEPILFVHGTKSPANIFLLNSFDAAPKDLTKIDFEMMSLDELNEALAREPSAKSLPLLALNCGREVWLWDRRGRPGSQQLVNDPKSIKATPSSKNNSLFGLFLNFLGSFLSATQLPQQVVFATDKKFWNFSMDQQAADDFPETVDFILEKSPWAKRVAIVGHSAGAALPLMALSLYPTQLAPKISACILWSASFARGNGNQATNDVQPLRETPIGPDPAPYQTNPYQTKQMLLCARPETWETLDDCSKDSQLGDSGGQQSMRAPFWAGYEYSTSSRELSQLDQSARFPPDRTMHMYDYGPEGNRVAYKQETPPAYDLARLKNFSGLSFYVGATDSRVTPADVEKTRQQLNVPSQYHLIEGTFNHIGYFFHIDVAILVNIPSMQELEILV